MTTLEVLDAGQSVNAQDYADHITASWQASVAGIIGCGRWLIEAKWRLPYGDFGTMFAEHDNPVERPVPFGARAGQYLMAIAHSALSDANHGSHLPTHWRTLYHLSRLGPLELEAAIDAGKVHPEMERGDADGLVKLAQRDAIPPASKVGASGDRRGEGWEVYLGDFAERLKDLDAGVDLIVTDPPYSDDALELYREFAVWAAEALRPGGVAAVYAGTYRLREVLDSLFIEGQLEQRWTFCLDLQVGSQARFMSSNLIQRWKPIVIAYRPPWRPPPWGPDVLVSPGPQKNAHPWQQNIEPVRQLVARYSAPGWVVADPFLGAGTTGHAALELGRTFIGCDIDPACVGGFGAMTRTVPRDVSAVIRHVVDASEIGYRARGAAEAVFADMRIVPFVQLRALERWQAGRWPTVAEMVALVVAERLNTLGQAGPDARSAFYEHHDDVEARAAKLVYDGWVEVDAMSQVADLTGAPVVLNQVNDTDHKVDALMYVPREWYASPTCTEVRLAFARKTLSALDARERRRHALSQAQWEFRCPMAKWEWVGDYAHVGFFPRAFMAAELDALRFAITTQPTLWSVVS